MTKHIEACIEVTCGLVSVVALRGALRTDEVVCVFSVTSSVCSSNERPSRPSSVFSSMPSPTCRSSSSSPSTLPATGGSSQWRWATTAARQRSYLPPACVMCMSETGLHSPVPKMSARSHRLTKKDNPSPSNAQPDVYATRQVCRSAEKTVVKKTTLQKKNLVTFMQTRYMYLHFTRSNNYNFSSRVKTC